MTNQPEELLTEQEHNQRIDTIMALLMTTTNTELQERLWEKADYHTDKISFGLLKVDKQDRS